MDARHCGCRPSYVPEPTQAIVSRAVGTRLGVAGAEVSESMTHANEELVRTFFHAFSRGDFRSAADMFADDVVLHVPGRNPFAGTIRGREAWLASLAKYAEAQAAGITLGFEVHDVVGGEDHAIALLNVWAEGRGERV